MGIVERVHFRFIQMPCCSFLYCNVNPRLPSYCPECGVFVLAEVRAGIRLSDDDAKLHYDETKLV